MSKLDDIIYKSQLKTALSRGTSGDTETKVLKALTKDLLRELIAESEYELTGGVKPKVAVVRTDTLLKKVDEL